MRPEAELLICCAQARLNSEGAGRIRALLLEDIDWDYLLRTAFRHGMMPLLYWHLNATCPEAVPKASMDYLRDYFHENARRNLYLTWSLCRLLKLFEANGIATIPFRGPALAAAVYGNLALRQFSDLDLLVHKDDVVKAKKLLVSQGYRPEFNLTGAQEAAFLQCQCEHHFLRDEDSVIVDIHWEIVAPSLSFQLDSERLWKNLERISIGGTEVLTLSAEDLLLVLCVHGAKHLWERLAWICDVAKLIGVPKGMDWRRIVEQAEMLGGRRMLFLGLYLASGLLGAGLPEEIGQRMQADPAAKALAWKIRERLFQSADRPPGIIESRLFHLKARERLPDRIRCGLHLAISPTVVDWQFLPLPASLSFLYYLLRPLRLVGQYGLPSLRRLLGPERRR